MTLSPISLSSSVPTISVPHHSSLFNTTATSLNLRFCTLRPEAFTFTSLRHRSPRNHSLRRTHLNAVSAAISNNGTPPKSFDYDLLIIGAGVGGHGAALHAVEKVRYMLLQTELIQFAAYVQAISCFHKLSYQQLMNTLFSCFLKFFQTFSHMLMSIDKLDPNFHYYYFVKLYWYTFKLFS